MSERRLPLRRTGVWVPLSALSALLLNLVFPHPGLSYLAWVSLAPLFYVILTEKFGRAFLASVVAGFLFNIVYILWMKEYKHPASLSGGVFGEMVFFCLAALLAWALSRCVARFRALALALGWFVLDYVKTIGFLGFPWGILGYSQYDNLTLIQSASVLGVWGIDGLILFVNALLAAAAADLVRTRSLPIAARRRVPSLAVVALLFAAMTGFGVFALRREGDAGYETRRVALVQANFDPWSPNLRENLHTEMGLTLSALEKNPDLVVWSESSVPFPYEFFLEKGNGIAESVHDFVLSVKKPFLFGTLEFQGEYESGEYDGVWYNVAVFYDREGRRSSYRKIHLVPFGEWFPFDRIFPFVDLILDAAGAGDFLPGGEYTAFDAGDFRFSVLVCFEDAFGDLARRFVGGARPAGGRGIDGERIPRGVRRLAGGGGGDRAGVPGRLLGLARGGTPRKAPGLLVNVTNDAWSGSRKAELQHFSISVFRAIENRVGFARAANGGVTACVDTTGRVVDSLEMFTTGVLVCDVPIGRVDRLTFYSRFGDLPVRIVAILTGVMLVLGAAKKLIDRRKKPPIM